MPAKLHRHHGKPCHWCKRPMLMESAALQPTRDHVIPRARGGTEIVIACMACNHLKADMHPAMWLLMLQKRFDEVLAHFGRPGPRGMQLFYSLFGEELAPHMDRVTRDAMNRFPEYGEITL